MQGKGRCVSVSALASEGVVAEKMLGRPCEDTITLTAEWENLDSEDQQKSKGTYLIYKILLNSPIVLLNSGIFYNINEIAHSLQVMRFILHLGLQQKPMFIPNNVSFV